MSDDAWSPLRGIKAESAGIHEGSHMGTEGTRKAEISTLRDRANLYRKLALLNCVNAEMAARVAAYADELEGEAKALEEHRKSA